MDCYDACGSAQGEVIMKTKGPATNSNVEYLMLADRSEILLGQGIEWPVMHRGRELCFVTALQPLLLDNEDDKTRE